MKIQTYTLICALIGQLLTTAQVDSSFTAVPERSYTATKEHIATKRQHFQTLDDSIALTQAAAYFTEALVHQIFPYWYGTDWDFNGYSAVPGQGSIACGYFVSTTLRDMGLNVNRFHLAQEGGWNEAKTLAPQETLTVYRNISAQQLKTKFMQEHQEGLYFVGLDNHVGFLYFHKAELYFIHSDYISDRVKIETAASALALESTLYVLADITYNPELMKKWLNQETLKVCRQ